MQNSYQRKENYTVEECYSSFADIKINSIRKKEINSYDEQ